MGAPVGRYAEDMMADASKPWLSDSARALLNDAVRWALAAMAPLIPPGAVVIAWGDGLRTRVSRRRRLGDRRGGGGIRRVLPKRRLQRAAPPAAPPREAPHARGRAPRRADVVELVDEEAGRRP